MFTYQAAQAWRNGILIDTKDCLVLVRRIDSKESWLSDREWCTTPQYCDNRSWAWEWSRYGVSESNRSAGCSCWTSISGEADHQAPVSPMLRWTWNPPDHVYHYSMWGRIQVIYRSPSLLISCRDGNREIVCPRKVPGAGIPHAILIQEVAPEIILLGIASRKIELSNVELGKVCIFGLKCLFVRYWEKEGLLLFTKLCSKINRLQSRSSSMMQTISTKNKRYIQSSEKKSISWGNWNSFLYLLNIQSPKASQHHLANWLHLPNTCLYDHGAHVLWRSLSFPFNETTYPGLEIKVDSWFNETDLC